MNRGMGVLHLLSPVVVLLSLCSVLEDVVMILF